MQFSGKSLVALSLGLVATSAASADLVVGWTITTAFPTGTGNVPTGTYYSVGAGDMGALTTGSNLSTTHALPASTYTSPSGNGSQYSFSSNNWSIGDYYEARFSTVGYEDIEVSWDQARSSTGPVNFEVVMSVDGGANFSFVMGYNVLQSGGGGSPGTWTTSTYNPLYTNLTALDLNTDGITADNRAEVIVRFRAITAPSGLTGSNRIDNVMINGSAVPAPGALALLGLAGFAGRRRR